MTNMNESNDFTGDNTDEFDELLASLPGLSPIVPGKRGGGRKATNNIGADDLGLSMLKTLRSDNHVDLFKAGNLKGNTLWGVIDQKSFDRANQISRNIEPSYSQVGILAVSLAQSNDRTIFVQWWKATIVKGVLSYQKILRKGADYQLCTNQKGQYGIWKMDSTNGLPQEKDNGDYFSFPYNELVDFEVYLNAIVEVHEVPVSFPNEEVSQLQGLSEILANVNLTVTSEPVAVMTADEEDDE